MPDSLADRIRGLSLDSQGVVDDCRAAQRMLGGDAQPASSLRPVTVLTDQCDGRDADSVWPCTADCGGKLCRFPIGLRLADGRKILFDGDVSMAEAQEIADAINAQQAQPAPETVKAVAEMLYATWWDANGSQTGKWENTQEHERVVWRAMARAVVSAIGGEAAALREQVAALTGAAQAVLAYIPTGGDSLVSCRAQQLREVLQPFLPVALAEGGAGGTEAALREALASFKAAKSGGGAGE